MPPFQRIFLSNIKIGASKEQDAQIIIYPLPPTELTTSVFPTAIATSTAVHERYDKEGNALDESGEGGKEEEGEKEKKKKKESSEKEDHSNGSNDSNGSGEQDDAITTTSKSQPPNEAQIQQASDLAEEEIQQNDSHLDIHPLPPSLLLQTQEPARRKNNLTSNKHPKPYQMNK